MPFSFDKALPFALGLLLVFAACDSDDEPTQPETVFATFDANSDGVVEFEEFGPIIRNYADIDEDGSGDFSAEEFVNVVLRAFDSDENGIDEGEFEAAADLFLDGDRTFSDYDADEDGTIQEDELTDSFDTGVLFGEFDTSGGDGNVLSPSELARGLFDLIDLDGDSALDEDEFNDGVSVLFGVELPRPQQ